MTELNAAYRVLGDPDRRARFDRSERPVVPAPTAATPAAKPSAVPAPEHSGFPWRSTIIAAVVGTVAVGAVSLAAGPSEDAPPDGVVTIGSCVEVLAVNEVGETDCDNPDALVVETMVPLDGRCPGNRVEYRDRLGLGKVCVDR